MELRGVAFAASVPEQLWPELELWAKRACLRTAARKPVLYGLRDAFGSAAEIASCIRKSFGRRGADLGSLPADAALWIRVLDSAAFEALASETAPQTEARAPAEAPVAHEAPAQSPLAIATASAPLALPRVAAAVGSEAATSVAAGMPKPQRCPNQPPRRGWTWTPSPLSPDFQQKSQELLRELRASQATAAAARLPLNVVALQRAAPAVSSAFTTTHLEPAAEPLAC